MLDFTGVVVVLVILIKVLGVCDFLGVHLSLMMMLKDALKSQQSLIEARAEDKEAGEPVATMLNFSTISVSKS